MGRPEIWNDGDNTPTTTDTKRVLLIKMIRSEQSGGGGAGVQQVFPGHYAGGSPVFTPPAPYAVAKDLDPPFITWFWNPDSSAWE